MKGLQINLESLMSLINHLHDVVESGCASNSKLGLRSFSACFWNTLKQFDVALNEEELESFQQIHKTHKTKS